MSALREEERKVQERGIDAASAFRSPKASDFVMAHSPPEAPTPSRGAPGQCTDAPPFFSFCGSANIAARELPRRLTLEA
jgi:hypothetical protein